jgi:L-seryl-tRNA(Ser) seleniumtransferase
MVIQTRIRSVWVNRSCPHAEYFHKLDRKKRIVVNNNASAVLLVLAALANRRKVIVSRTQLIEIGGGFRLPDIMKQSGAKLMEVGTTNRVHLNDYREALQADASLVLHAHRSNFKLVGFT